MRLLGGSRVILGARPAAPEASWKIAPEEAERLSQTAPEGWWQRLFGWLFLVAGAVTLFVLAPTEPTALSSAMAVLKAIVLLAIAQVGLVFLLNRQTNEVDLGPGLKRVRSKIPVEDATPHRILISQKGTLTGADEGYLWFDEGTLFFKGLQCAFRLNPEDILPLEKWSKRERAAALAGRSIRHISLNLGSREARLELKPIDPFEDYATRRRAHRFQVDLGEWLTERPKASIESVLPPLDVHPSLMTPARRSKEGLVTGAILVAFNILLLFSVRLDLSLQTTASLTTLLHMASSLGLLGLSVRFTWQQWLDISHRHSIFLENELSRPL